MSDTQHKDHDSAETEQSSSLVDSELKKKQKLDLKDEDVRNRFVEEELAKIEGIQRDKYTITCPTFEIFKKFVAIMQKIDEDPVATFEISIDQIPSRTWNQATDRYYELLNAFHRSVASPIAANPGYHSAHHNVPAPLTAFFLNIATIFDFFNYCGTCEWGPGRHVGFISFDATGIVGRVRAAVYVC
jgi:hypothetical protein